MSDANDILEANYLIIVTGDETIHPVIADTRADALCVAKSIAAVHGSDVMLCAVVKVISPPARRPPSAAAPLIGEDLPAWLKPQAS